MSIPSGDSRTAFLRQFGGRQTTRGLWAVKAALDVVNVANKSTPRAELVYFDPATSTRYHYEVTRSFNPRLFLVEKLKVGPRFWDTERTLRPDKSLGVAATVGDAMRLMSRGPGLFGRRVYGSSGAVGSRAAATQPFSP